MCIFSFRGGDVTAWAPDSAVGPLKVISWTEGEHISRYSVPYAFLVGLANFGAPWVAKNRWKPNNLGLSSVSESICTV